MRAKEHNCYSCYSCYGCNQLHMKLHEGKYDLWLDVIILLNSKYNLHVCESKYEFANYDAFANY